MTSSPAVAWLEGQFERFAAEGGEAEYVTPRPGPPDELADWMAEDRALPG